MKPKRVAKMIVDILMLPLLLFLMAHYLTGGTVHEWAGILMIALFISHIIFNIAWFRNIFRGYYDAKRIMQTVINLLLTVAMLGLFLSGLLLSDHVFAWLSFPGATAFGRMLHHICAYWMFVLISMHLGLHGKMFLKMLGNVSGMAMATSGQKVSLRIVATLLSSYGLFAFIKRQIGLYMLNIVSFSFFDYEQPLVFLISDYLSVVLFWAIGSYYLNVLLSKKTHQTTR